MGKIEHTAYSGEEGKTGENAGQGSAEPSIIAFKDKTSFSRDEWFGELERVKEEIEDAVLVWRDKDGDVWFLPMEMSVSRCVGILEIAKHLVISNYEEHGEH